MKIQLLRKRRVAGYINTTKFSVSARKRDIHLLLEYGRRRGQYLADVAQILNKILDDVHIEDDIPFKLLLNFEGGKFIIKKLH